MIGASRESDGVRLQCRELSRIVVPEASSSTVMLHLDAFMAWLTVALEVRSLN